jgi:DNA-binding transcriptional ArsR family regulator
MLRIQLTAGDLARVRFEVDPGPLVDVGQAARALRRRPPAALAHWWAATRPLVDRSVHPLLALTPPVGPTWSLIDPLDADLSTGLALLDAVPAAQLRAEIEDMRVRPTAWLKQLAGGDRAARRDVGRAMTRLHAVGVAPVAAHLAADRETDVARRAAELGTSGLARFMAGLHSSVALRGQVLEIERPFSYTHRSDGLGVVLVPSPFLAGEVRVALAEGEPLRIFYPTGTPVPSRAGADGDDPLARMLGSTRAAVLRAVGTGCGTVTLSRRVGSSPATASEHVSVLRAAGLVATARVGRGVRHWLTPLGAQVLKRSTPPPRP